MSDKEEMDIPVDIYIMMCDIYFITGQKFCRILISNLHVDIKYIIPRIVRKSPVWEDSEKEYIFNFITKCLQASL